MEESKIKLQEELDLVKKEAEGMRSSLRDYADQPANKSDTYLDALKNNVGVHYYTLVTVILGVYV